MLLTEYDEAKAMELFREDGRREGIIGTLRSLVAGGLLSVADAAGQARTIVPEFERAASELVAE